MSNLNVLVSFSNVDEENKNKEKFTSSLNEYIKEHTREILDSQKNEDGYNIMQWAAWTDCAIFTGLLLERGK